MIHAITDTHTLLWYLLGSPRLSVAARTVFETALNNRMNIGISTINVVEIIYLTEKGRVPSEALLLLEEELSQEDKLFELIPLTYEIAKEVQNVPYHQVSDLPDRIVAATALYHKVPLISRDRKIQMSDVETIW